MVNLSGSKVIRIVPSVPMGTAVGCPGIPMGCIRHAFVLVVVKILGLDENGLRCGRGRQWIVFGGIVEEG